MAARGSGRKRVLCIPGVVPSHYNPTLLLMRQLARHGADLTVWSTAEVCSKVRSQSAKGAFGTADVEAVELFQWGSGRSMLHATETLTQQMNSASSLGLDLSRFRCVISGMFCSFTQALADEWEIPNYFFYTSPAADIFTFLHGPRLIDQGWIPQNRDKRDKLVPFPGLENWVADEIPGVIHEVPRTVIDSLEDAYRKAAGFLVNTFEDYESASIHELRLYLESQSRPGKRSAKVYTVGPLLFMQEPCNVTATDDYLRWLDQQPDTSVLFACFGSVRAMSEAFIAAVARALLLTEVPFFWALRLPPEKSEEDVLPGGFKAQTQHRGIIVTSWVPQKQILRHPSVGGFLSHCGWNSSLESIAGGVPIVGCPMYAEQGLIARQLSQKEIGVAVRVKGHVGTFEADDIAAGIRTVMKGSQGEEMRKKVQILKVKAIIAVGYHGSSYEQMQEFMGDIKDSEQ